MTIELNADYLARALASLGDVAEIELRLSGPIAPDAGNRNPGAFKPARTVPARLFHDPLDRPDDDSRLFDLDVVRASPGDDVLGSGQVPGKAAP